MRFVKSFLLAAAFVLFAAACGTSVTVAGDTTVSGLTATTLLAGEYELGDSATEHPDALVAQELVREKIITSAPLITPFYDEGVPTPSLDDVIGLLRDNPDGFTASPTTEAHAASGFAVAIENTELKIEIADDPAAAVLERAQAWLDEMSPHFQSERVWIGGYRNPESGESEINLTLVFSDKDAATEFSYANSQGSGWDIVEFETIDTSVNPDGTENNGGDWVWYANGESAS